MKQQTLVFELHFFGGVNEKNSVWKLTQGYKIVR